MDRVTLSVPSDAAFGGTLRLVVGGVGSRSRLSYEQVDELQLAVEVLVAHREVAGEHVRLDADVDEHGVVLRLGPFVPGDDRPRRRVLDRLVDAVRLLPEADGEWVELAVRRRQVEVGT